MSKTSGETKPLNVRDVPIALYWQIKMTAAARRLTLRAFVLSVLEAAVEKDVDTSKHPRRLQS